MPCHGHFSLPPVPPALGTTDLLSITRSHLSFLSACSLNKPGDEFPYTWRGKHQRLVALRQIAGRKQRNWGVCYIHQHYPQEAAVVLSQNIYQNKCWYVGVCEKAGLCEVAVCITLLSPKSPGWVIAKQVCDVLEMFETLSLSSGNFA